MENINDLYIKELRKEIKAIERRKVITIDALMKKIRLNHELALALGEIDEAEFNRLERGSFSAEHAARMKAQTKEHYISPKFRNKSIIVIKGKK